MTKKSVFLILSAWILASTLQAEVVIRRYEGPPPQRLETLSPEPGESISEGLATKGERPSNFYIVPLIKIDTNDPNGETTFLSIRNESSAVQVVRLSIHPTDSLDAQPALQNALLPKETWVLNLRNVADVPPRPDGVIRAWGRIFAEGSEAVSADFFQFNPSQDFATGSQPVDITGGEFCELVKSRFLVGGTFDGGTLITMMLDFPLGSDPMTDPPSVTGVVYQEDGSPAGSFEIFTDQYSLDVNAADILNPGVNFGTMDLTFENDFSGGFAFTEFKANNRFSVGLKSTCLDPVMLP